MNWKPAIVGALVVVVAGFGVGYAVDRTSKADTVTVARTVTVATTVTAAAPQTTPVEGTDTISTTTPSDRPTPAVPDGRSTYLSELEDDAIVDDVTLGSPPAVTIGHTTFANGTTADDLFDYDCDTPATAEYPVRGETSTFAAKLGWTQSSDSSASAIFEIRANGNDGERLYRRTFDGPSEPVDVVVPLRGAIKMVLMWQRTDDSCEPAAGMFGLGDARIVDG
jgi:hypothetical protein